MACAVALWMCSQLGRTSQRRGMPMLARYVAWLRDRFGVVAAPVRGRPVHTGLNVDAWVVLGACTGAVVTALVVCGRRGRVQEGTN